MTHTVWDKSTRAVIYLCDVPLSVSFRADGGVTGCTASDFSRLFINVESFPSEPLFGLISS